MAAISPSIRMIQTNHQGRGIYPEVSRVLRAQPRDPAALKRLAICAVAAAVIPILVIPQFQKEREAGARQDVKNDLKQIMLSLHNYHDQQSTLCIKTSGSGWTKREPISSVLPKLASSGRMDSTSTTPLEYVDSFSTAHSWSP